MEQSEFPVPRESGRQHITSGKIQQGEDKTVCKENKGHINPSYILSNTAPSNNKVEGTGDPSK
jgi:hypothetical protein